MLVIVVVLIILFILFMMWILDTFLMSYVYRNEKISNMETTFRELDEASIKGGLYDEDFDRTFEQLSFNYNLDIAVMSYDGSILLSGGKDTRNTILRVIDAVLSDKSSDKYLVQSQSYSVSLVEDKYVDDEYLVLVGTLSDGNLIMIRYAVANMNLTMQILDRTLVIVALLSFVVAFILIEIFTRRLTQPIHKLTELSKRMSEQDFGAKYEPRNVWTEIDVLGDHMNTMSESLENTLVEIKKANAQLKKDIELKEKNEEMRSEFLSAVSHELKTPISLIQGYAEGLTEGMADDKESRDYYCDVIVDESLKMNHMVNQLLSLNDLEYGQETYEKTKFNITELIRTVVDSSNILIEQKDITLEYEIDNDIEVESSENLVYMAFSNYLSNAIHYCTGDKIIRVTQRDKGDKVCVSVYNSGDNIPEEIIERLWERFYKADKARTREYGGSGVGLSIVKASIETLGGRYGVYNLESGVTFWFEIYK